MTLSTSDWIAIMMGIASIASTWGAVFWQVRKTLPSAAPPVKKPIALNSSNKIMFVRRYWQSFMSIAFGVFGLGALLVSPTSPDKFFIVGCILFVLIIFAHLLAIVFFEFMREYSGFMVNQISTVIDHEKNLTLRSRGTPQKRGAP